MLYGPKNLSGKLVLMANRNLDLQIAKLCKDGLILEHESGFRPVEVKL